MTETAPDSTGVVSVVEARRLRPCPLVTYSPKVFIPLTTLCRDV